MRQEIAGDIQAALTRFRVSLALVVINQSSLRRRAVREAPSLKGTFHPLEAARVGGPGAGLWQVLAGCALTEAASLSGALS